MPVLKRPSQPTAPNQTFTIMSYDEQIDGVTMDLNDALMHLAKHYVYGTLLVSATHSLAYYEQCELADLTRLLSAVPAC